MWQVILSTLLVSVVTAVLAVVGKAVNDWSKKLKVETQIAEGEELRAVAGELRAVAGELRAAAGEQRAVASEAAKETHTIKAEAIEALRIGVATAQQQIVDGVKAAAKDGKITKEELKAELENAKKLAKRTAFDIATGPVANYLKALTDNALEGIIQLLLGFSGKSKD